MISGEISKGIYRVVMDGGSNVYIFRTSIGVALIDAGGDRKGTEITSALDELELSPKDVRLVLLTHGHEGHIQGASIFTEAEVCLHRSDIDLATFRGGILNILAKPFKRDDPTLTFKPLMGYDHIPFGERNFLALHTPGHTGGSVCYLSGDLLFSGDMLSNTHGLRLGSTDDSSSPSENFIASIRKLRDYVFYFICPGHGEVVKDGKMQIYRLLEGITSPEAK